MSVLSIAGIFARKAGALAWDGVTTGVEMTGRGIARGATSVIQRQQTKKDQRASLIEAAFLNADSDKMEAINRWMEKTFDNKKAFGFVEGYSNKLIVSKDDVLKHLNKLSDKERNALTEKRGEYLRKDAGDYFKNHYALENVAVRKEDNLKEVSFRSPVASSFNLIANARERSKNEAVYNENLKKEQTERLLAMAIGKAETTEVKDVKAWLNERFKNGEAKFYVDADDGGLKVGLTEVKDALDKLDKDQKAAMIAAREAYLKGDEPVAAAPKQKRSGFGNNTSAPDNDPPPSGGAANEGVYAHNRSHGAAANEDFHDQPANG